MLHNFLLCKSGFEKGVLGAENNFGIMFTIRFSSTKGLYIINFKIVKMDILGVKLYTSEV